MKAQFCPRCGHGNPPEAKFCPACGSRQWVEGTDPLQATLVAGRYRLLDKIDESSVGPLYRAEDLQYERAVAVRLLDPSLTLDGEALERVQAEMRFIGAHVNEHLVPLLDFGSTSDGRLFVAMGSPKGDSLRAALDHEVQLTVPRVIDILRQIAETLSRPHASGWIHGDLRPKNVLLVPLAHTHMGAAGTGAVRGGGKDFIRLLDFGLAQLLLSSARSGAASPRLTYGDPHYMAPEQALGEPVDGRADLHAMGVLGYEMLVGELPFAGTHPGETLERLLGTVRPSVRARRPECPEWLDALLRRAMARRPEERFSGVDQLLEYLARGGEATPVELVAERARSDKLTATERAPEMRESVPSTGSLVGDPVIVQPEAGQASGGSSVPGLAESEAAMNLVASQALSPRSDAAAAGQAALSVGTGPAGGRHGVRPGEGTSGTESEPVALHARSENHQAGAALARAVSVPIGRTAPAAAEKKAAEPSASTTEGQSDLAKAVILSEGRPRGELTDQFWFNSAPDALALGDEEYADGGPRRELGPMVGLIVGGVFLFLVLAIALWPKHSAPPAPGSSAAPAGHPQ